jgi:uncharacterized membrane protein YebE (DUF533 family)
MRNAIVQLPQHRTVGERRQVLRAVIRQLERAEIYVAAAAFMGIDDRPARRALNQLRTDLNSLRPHLNEQRVGIIG